jgi:eukaryotic-like serine/threonine-protein kinase
MLAASNLMDQLHSQLDYEFEGHRLDTRQQVLVSPQGQVIRLNSKAFETLLYLVQHAGEPVDKRTLMEAVWPNVIVEENNLNQCIVAVRRALGESAGERRFILTLPGRGFKFVAAVRSVQALADLDPAPPQTPMPPLPAAPPRSRPPTALYVIVTALLIAAGTGWFFYSAQLPVTRAAEYEQLTDEVEGAASPALSADGRLLAFIRGGRQFLGPGQIYLKVLPSGEPVRLSDVRGLIYAPAFSSDGTRVSFTFAGENDEPRNWQTLTVPIVGGEPSRLLPNASGLSWIAPHTLMYSEIRSGAHMGIVTSTESRAERREIYYPLHERGMAHFSYLSPDQRSVLVVEMAPSGDFERCRLLPYDGQTAGRPIGPNGRCLAAAWSPDGHWMFFSAEVAGHWHLWRQRFPDGDPQQITFGPHEEGGVLVSPDGRSLITSLGSESSAIWIHDARGEQRLTDSNYASQPWYSEDARRVYFLSAQSARMTNELVKLDVETRQQERLLPGFDIESYDVSTDERQVVFSTHKNGEAQTWIANADRQIPPRLIARGGDQAVWGGQRIFYRKIGAHINLLFSMNADGALQEQVLKEPILDLFSVSPDGEWVDVGSEVNGRADGSIIKTRSAAVAWHRGGWWIARWSHDGRRLFFPVSAVQANAGNQETRVISIAAEGLSAESFASSTDGERIPHPIDTLYPGPSGASYLFVKSERRQNIFRIPLH